MTDINLYAPEGLSRLFAAKRAIYGDLRMMSEPPPENDPPDATAAELKTLREEKAAREKADREAAAAESEQTKAELVQLKQEKADRDAADAKRVKTPAKKAEKEPAVPEGVTKPKRRTVSRLLGDHYYED